MKHSYLKYIVTVFLCFAISTTTLVLIGSSSIHVNQQAIEQYQYSIVPPTIPEIGRAHV